MMTVVSDDLSYQDDDIYTFPTYLLIISLFYFKLKTLSIGNSNDICDTFIFAHPTSYIRSMISLRGSIVIALVVHVISLIEKSRFLLTVCIWNKIEELVGRKNAISVVSKNIVPLYSSFLLIDVVMMMYLSIQTGRISGSFSMEFA